MSRYDRYFLNQIGGAPEIGPVYRRHAFIQRGRGLGNIFTNLIKFLRPYIYSGTKAVGQEVLRSGSEILGNLGTQPIQELLKSQRDKSVKNLALKAEHKLNKLNSSGRGIKTMTGRDDSFIRQLKSAKRRLGISKSDGDPPKKRSKKKPVVEKREISKNNSKKSTSKRIPREKSSPKALSKKEFLKKLKLN